MEEHKLQVYENRAQRNIS